MMKVKDFVAKLTEVAKNYKTVYALGMFGQPITDAIIKQKAKQLPDFYTAEKQAELKKLVGKGYFGFDCVCLIKGILWGWNGDLNHTNGGATYCSNNVPDISDAGMLSVCTEVSTNFADIEVGEYVWMSGHCGVYIGDGLVVECTPKWENKVQITALANIGTKSGYNSRRWTKHGKLPYVEYEATKPVVTPTDYKVGDTVEFTGCLHYTSAYATGVAKACKAGLAKVINTCKGKPHPYCLQAVAGKGGTVHGWVNEADIKSNNTSTPTTTTTTAKPKIKAGNAVTLKATNCYTSESAKTSYSKKTGTFYLWDATVKNGRIRITNRADRVGVAGQVTCWVTVADIT